MALLIHSSVAIGPDHFRSSLECVTVQAAKKLLRQCYVHMHHIAPEEVLLHDCCQFQIQHVPCFGPLMDASVHVPHDINSQEHVSDIQTSNNRGRALMKIPSLSACRNFCHICGMLNLSEFAKHYSF
jgi:hypothetical protein